MKRIIGSRTFICVVVALLFASVVTGVVWTSMSAQARVASMQEHMAQEVFRFHVLANSDSEEDQNLKMAVKGDILSYMKESLPYSDSVDRTKVWAKSHLQEIQEVARNRIQREGYDYAVKVEVTTCYFPKKTYGDVTFPQGEYEALRVEIGSAKGHNWWCVLYPNLCFVDAVHAVVSEEGKAQLREALDEEEYELVTGTPKIKVKWFFSSNQVQVRRKMK